MFTVTTDGLIQTDDIEQAVALARLLRANPAPARSPAMVAAPVVLAAPATPMAPVASAPTAAKESGPAEDRAPRRRWGTGSIFKNGKGWRWKFGKVNGPTVETREAAERSLDEHIRTAGKAPAQAEPGDEDETEDAGDDDDVEPDEDADLPPPAPIPPPGVFARLPPAPAPIIASAAGFIHPGSGWGAIAPDGTVEHLHCKGTGFTATPGEKARGRCYGCQGQGKKKALPRPRR